MTTDTDALSLAEATPSNVSYRSRPGPIVERPWNPRFWVLYAQEARPYLLFVSGFAGAAGVALTASGFGLRIAGALLGAWAAYGFGQAFTDCWQTDTDALSAPHRPLAAGRLRRSDVLGISLVGLTVCAALLAFAHPANVVLGLCAVAMLATYTPAKRRWWAGPAYNAVVVLLLFLMGVLAGAGPATDPGLLGRPDVGLVGWSVLTGYAHFVLTGYLKDVEADRRTGYATLPVRFGRRTAEPVADALAAAFLIGIAATLLRHSAPGILAWGLAAASASAMAVCSLRLRASRSDRLAYRAVVPGLHGLVLGLSAIVVASQPAWAAGVLVGYAAFTLVIARRPDRAQV